MIWFSDIHLLSCLSLVPQLMKANAIKPDEIRGMQQFNRRFIMSYPPNFSAISETVLKLFSENSSRKASRFDRWLGEDSGSNLT